MSTSASRPLHHLTSRLFTNNRLTLITSHSCSTTFGELIHISHCLNGATFSSSVAVPYPASFRKVTREVAGILPQTKRLWPQARCVRKEQCLNPKNQGTFIFRIAHCHCMYVRCRGVRCRTCRRRRRSDAVMGRRSILEYATQSHDFSFPLISLAVTS